MDSISSINHLNQKKFDKFSYSNGTLKNKLGIHDSRELALVEYLNSAKTMYAILKHRPPVKSLAALRVIHRYMFSDLYSWAGKVRNFDISKNGHDFLPHAAMGTAESYINGMLHTVNAKRKPLAMDYAKLLDSINDMHPFREGNGRSTKTFLECVAIQHGQFLQYDRHEHDAIIGLNNADIPRIAKHIHVQKLTPSRTLSQQLAQQRKHAEREAQAKGMDSPHFQKWLRRQTASIGTRSAERKRKYAEWKKQSKARSNRMRHSIRKRAPRQKLNRHRGPTLD